MLKRPVRTALGVAAALAVLVLVGLTGHVRLAAADTLHCSQVKCVALTFDDGPSPSTERLLEHLRPNGAQATFFLIGDKVAADPAGAQRIAGAGMEIGNHTWEHPNLTTIPPQDIPAQFSKASEAIAAPTGRRPPLVTTAAGLTNDAGRQGLAAINWDVIPFDWVNDSNLAASRALLMSQIRPNSVVLLHDTFSSTVDLVAQFIPILKANGYHLVTVTQLLGPRTPGSLYGGRENGPPVNDLVDIPPEP